MAAVEKLFGTKKQHAELKSWLEHKSEDHGDGDDDMVLAKMALGRLYDPPLDDGLSHTIAIFSFAVDGWLLLVCEMPWVINQIIGQYAIHCNDCGSEEIIIP